MSQETLIRGFSMARKHGLHSNTLNIIGIPGETYKYIWGTIKLNRKLRHTVSSCNTFYPYKGSNPGDYCFDNDLVDLNKFNRFSDERRESTLNFPPEKQAQLMRFHDEWDVLVNPYNVNRRLLRRFGNSVAWKAARRVKRLVREAIERPSRPRQRKVKMPSKLCLHFQDFVDLKSASETR